MQDDDNYSLEDLMSQLNSLIGLEKVKSKVNDLIDFQKIQLLRKAKGLHSPKNTMHLAFTGNPGTFVKLEDTIESFEKIIAGEVDEIPESFFMYKATLKDVIAAYEEDKAKHGDE